MKKILLFLCSVLLLGGCQQSPDSATHENNTKKTYSTQIFAMDTVMDVSVFSDSDSILSEASSLVYELDHNLSTTNEQSEIYNLNKTGSASLSENSSLLLEKALDFCDKTDGALDISIYPVLKSWGFTTDSYQIPNEHDLNMLLENVDYQKIHYSPSTRSVDLPEGMEIDLGSVAKGFTGDMLVQLFKDNNISSALLNLGGNVQALGSKPDGSPWKIAIKSPESQDYLGILSLVDKAVITSGGYERYFKDESGNIYWHIIDPANGYPAKNGLISVTIIGSEGTYCDALSTSLFIMGTEKAIEFWKLYQDFDMILVTDNNEVLLTPGIENSFTLSDHSPYKLEVIKNAQN